jgi:hypothetical protein
MPGGDDPADGDPVRQIGQGRLGPRIAHQSRMGCPVFGIAAQEQNTGVTLADIDFSPDGSTLAPCR